MQVIGDVLAVAAVVGALGFVARGVSRMPQTPAPVRRAAGATAVGVRHPVRTARKGAPRAAESVETIWAKARAEDWLERRRARRGRREGQPPRSKAADQYAKAAGRGLGRAGVSAWKGARSIRLPRVAINVPGITDQPPAKPKSAGQPPATPPPAPASTPTPVRQPVPGRQPDMTTPRGSVPPHHAAVNAFVASFEPESDGDLIRFMSGEAAAMAGYSQAMEQLSEHLLNSVGLDPAAVQGMTEFAQAVTEAAALMTRANGRFQQAYQGVRETVAGGTVLPFKGRWITGESA